ncbi:MAG: phosphatidylserine decarboxylase family protein [Saprospiraceae bacterium]
MIHREGYLILFSTVVVLTILNVVVAFLAPVLASIVLVLSIVVFLLVLQFFRNPKRLLQQTDDHLVYAPADGKVVVIETAEEPEYFKEKRLMISIFMSPVNVHCNRNPVSGIVKYKQYHPGKYLVAWHPKSSTENERTTVVIDNGSAEVLVRQIAGAVARRIKNYLQVGQQVTQGSEMGFIKFGSRVDLFLPLDAKVAVKIGQTVRGNVDVIAQLD